MQAVCIFIEDTNLHTKCINWTHLYNSGRTFNLRNYATDFDEMSYWGSSLNRIGQF